MAKGVTAPRIGTLGAKARAIVPSVWGRSALNTFII